MLGDDSPHWHPSSFSEGQLGCGVNFAFLTAKLLDFAERRSSAEAARSPVEIVVRGHLATLRIRGDNEARAREKLRLIRRLYQTRLSAKEAREFFRFLDRILAVPPDVNKQVWEDVRLLEDQGVEKFIPWYERAAHEAGLKLGRQEAQVEEARRTLKRLAKRKFGDAASALDSRLDALPLEAAHHLTDEVVAVASVSDFEALLRQQDAGQ